MKIEVYEKLLDLENACNVGAGRAAPALNALVPPDTKGR
jgi:hypothetical protein